MNCFAVRPLREPAESAQLPQALANVVLSVTACLAFTFLGIVAARHL